MEDTDILVWQRKIGLIIKTLRKIHKITQEKLEELSEVTTRQLSDIENGNADIKFSTLIKIASAFGLEVTDLLTFDVEKYEDYC